MENMMNTYQQETPTYCVNGCGFFGTAATMNMCSKCYREEQSVTVKAAVEKSISLLSLLQKELGSAKEVETSKEEVKRCMSCNKKFEVLGFKCKCGSTFCGTHRYPEQHNCTYDFKVAGKAVIVKENPLVAPDKLQKI